MPARWLFAGIALLAVLAGSALWLASRPGGPPLPLSGMPAPGAILAVPFRDLQGHPVSLARFQGKPLVVNFWATWCAPCRDEMPAFERLQQRWSGRAQFVGLSNEGPEKVAGFARDFGIHYPLWVGEEQVAELSRRMGNTASVLPYTVLLNATGGVVEVKAGTYSEAELETKLRAIAANGA
jgi:thiol-disulfide isomerase/thioredoxin